MYYDVLIPFGIFEVLENEDLFKFIFPNDCPYKGQFFYGNKSIVKIDEKAGGYYLKQKSKTLVALYDLEKRKYREIEWKYLAMQIENYLINRGDGKNEKDNY